MTRKHKVRFNHTGDVVILPITGGVDVFCGKGWDGWTRFNTQSGYPKMVAGAAMSDKQYGQVYSVVTGGKHG